MRVIYAAFILMAVSECGNRNDAITPLPAFTDRWETRGGTYADKPIFIRINRGLDSIADHAPLNWQAAVSVILKHPLDNGLPDDAERVVLDNIEKMVSYRLATTGLAAFGLRVESDGRCDFIFYTDNRRAVTGVFNSLRKTIGEYRIDFSIKHDTKWITYRWFSSWQ